MLRHKKSNKDLKRLHFILLEVGLALSLIIFIVAFSYNLGNENNKVGSDKSETHTEKREVIQSKEVVRTTQGNQPPRPPSPQPPVEVPNSEVIEGNVQEQLDQIDQQVSSGQKMSLPPPPEQNEAETEEKIFRIVEKEPQIVGGLDSLQSLIEYPELARKAGIEGRVYLEFIVTKKGKVENPKVLRGPGAGLNKEALRVIKKATFRPGLQQGRPVNVRYSMPIRFNLNKERGY